MLSILNRTKLKNYTQSRMSPFDEHALHVLLKKFNNNKLKILEIGSWFGAGSTQVFSHYASKIICVDTWMGNENAEHRSLVKQINPYELFLKNTYPFKEKIVSIRSHSNEVGSLLKDESFDFIFIDGDHRYEQTKSDIKNCLPKLKKIGIIAGHDCEGRVNEKNHVILNQNLDKDHIESIFVNFKHMHPGVIVAVDELLDNVELFADDKNQMNLNNYGEGPRAGFSSIWYKCFGM
jgi:predicted O-methyltransferase YrrM